MTAKNSLLCINHYRYGSFEYLYGIKELRGGGVHKNKYKYLGYFSKFMVLINSSNQTFMPRDIYLREKSKDLIKLCKKNVCKPKIELYPRSSWFHLKKNHREKYDEFSSWNKNGKLLNYQQINEINNYLNNIAENLF